MTLIHYSKEPFVFDRSRRYTQREPHGFGKPVGLWVSVAGEDDWKAWCEREGFFLPGLTHASEVTLTAAADILYISDGPQLEAFHQSYCVRTEFDRHYHYDDNRWWPVDWAVVAGKCDGIIIAPYLWSHRLSLTVEWYYSWDCASGCVWNLDAIESVEI